MATRRRRHLVCRVSFDGRDGHLHRATVRISAKGRSTQRTILRLAEEKTGVRAIRLFTLECAPADEGWRMPHRRRA